MRRLYAGTGNAGAGVGALLLPRVFGTDYQSAFLWSRFIAIALMLAYAMSFGLEIAMNATPTFISDTSTSPLPAKISG